VAYGSVQASYLMLGLSLLGLKVARLRVQVLDVLGTTRLVASCLVYCIVDRSFCMDGVDMGSDERALQVCRCGGAFCA
jgi:hypothetical protein